MKKISLLTLILAFVLLFMGVSFAYTKLKDNFSLGTTPLSVVTDKFKDDKPTPTAETKTNEPNQQDKNSSAENTDAPDTTEPPAEPIAVPDFELSDYDGNIVKLSDYLGKTVILNFWASWCPPCKAEMAEFNEMAAEFKEAGDAVLLSINMTDGQRETKETAKKFLDDNDYTLDVYYEQTGEVAGMFVSEGIPVTAIIDKNGNISSYIPGQTTKDVVVELVNKAREVE